MSCGSRLRAQRSPCRRWRSTNAVTTKLSQRARSPAVASWVERPDTRLLGPAFQPGARTSVRSWNTGLRRAAAKHVCAGAASGIIRAFVAHQRDGAIGDLLGACSASGELTTSPMASRSTKRFRSRPAIPWPPERAPRSPRCAAALSRPLRTAAMTASIAASGSVGMSSTSAPASSARTAPHAGAKPLAIPPISSASVTTMPLKPSSRASRPVRMAGESVAGRSGVAAPARRCAPS